MASDKLHSSGVAIVLIGSFNPGIFQPAWLALNGLIPKEELEDAETEVIRDQFARFSLGWVRVQVLQERLEVLETEESPSPGPVRDLLVGVLELLPHMPVRQMGINLWSQYEMPSQKEWHALGHRLVPPENWKENLRKPGLLSVQVQGGRPDDYTGAVNVTVNPSAIDPPGVFINVNDHYVLADGEEQATAGSALEVLRAVWDDSLSQSEKIRNSIIELA